MKARLFVLGGKDVGRSFLVEGKAFLGRSPECEIRLRDRSISRRHAELSWDGSVWTMADLGSRNGIRKDGQRRERFELTDHDEILLGELPLRFRLEVEEEPGVEPASAEIELEEEETAPEVELEEEIVLEGFEEEEAPPTPAETVLTDRARRRVEVIQGRAKAGLLSGDLSQRPLWVRLSVYFVLLVFAIGLSLLAYYSVQSIRGSL